MKNIQMIANTLFAISCALLIGSKSFAEPMNMAAFKNELRAYQSSGEYNNNIAAVAANAQNYITNQVNANNQANPKKKLAIVLDIDDTILSNYAMLAANNFCVSVEEFNQTIALAKDPAIPSMLKMYQSAVKQGVAIFFVTGRPPELQDATISNLKSAGFTTWAGIYFRPKNDKQPTVSPYKNQARSGIAQEGYTIIATIGDQQSDLTGANLGQTFKVPNPFYSIQ